jgi:thiamine pyrophosphate-dependent acetolactate synthase large subunit-like protein
VTVREAVADALARLGVRDVFGLVGSGNLELANGLVERGVAYHGVNHEASAVAAADGYARVSGAVGVATVHQGPGFTNTLTALIEAARSRTPLLLLAAETTYGNQALDQVAVAESSGAIGLRLAEPADAVTAFGLARNERRTVVLNLPVDVQRREAEPVEAVLPQPPEPLLPSEADVARLNAELAAAARPVLLAGRGALHAGEALARLADSSGALLATTAAAHGLFYGHTRSLGLAGGFASPLAQRLFGEADLVLAFGASLNRWTTHDEKLFPQARVVRIDVEAGDVRADARATAERLDVHGNGFGHALPELAAYRRRDEIDDRSTADTIDPRTLMAVLDDLLPEERCISIDSGHFMGWPAMYLTIRRPDQFVLAQGFQSVGLGLATAIGASVARRDRITIAVLGDGGARMSLPELDTAVRLGLPLLVVIVNDAGYGAEVHDFAPLGVDVDLARLEDVDLAMVAHGVRASGATIRSVEDIAYAWDTCWPLVLDCKVTSDVAADW